MIHSFAAHRIAPNLLMLLMLLSGLLVFSRMEVRFFPEFEIQTINVSVSWRNASAEDVVDQVLVPLENKLRDVPDMKELSSYARDGRGVLYLEFPDSKDMDEAAADVRRYLDQAKADLPTTSEVSEVQRVQRHDALMRLSLSGQSLAELRPLARRLENELRQLGLVQVEVTGLPPDEIQIQISHRQLQALGLTARDIGRQIAQQNIDVSAGDVDSRQASRLLRALSQRQGLQDFAQMQIIDGSGKVVRLGDIATLTRDSERDQTAVFFNGRPAVELNLTRKSGGNALAAAERIYAWLEETRAALPPGIAITPHRERWRAIESRLSLLINNGLQGLLLVLLMLVLFLDFRLAVWVAAGIPATFMVALCVLYLAGGSLNMISMFAFIMATGIVVDDAIVVGENGLYHLRRGRAPLEAAVHGSQEMFPAVFASTFTTIAAFLPLLIVGGTIGSIMQVIPIVIICVLVASLFECFFVLPGHMRFAFTRIARTGNSSRFREVMEQGFERFEQGWFRRSVEIALRYRYVTVVAVLTMLVLSVALVSGGFLKFRFFPGAELSRVQAQVSFVAGTPRAEVEHYIERLQDSLRQTVRDDFPQEEDLLKYVSVYLGQGGRRQGSGDERANLVAELSPPEERTIGTRAFVRAWRKRLPTQAGLEQVSLREARGGPAGEDLEVRLSGDDIDRLKAAAVELQTALLDVPGVSRPSDDLPYGKRQMVFELTPLGQALNLSVREVAAQLRDAYDGFEVQTLYEGIDEIPVRVLVRDAGGTASGDFSAFPLRLPSGEFVTLEEVARLSGRSGFNAIQREETKQVVNVVGSIDFAATDVARVQAQLAAEVLPPIVAKYGVDYSYEGSSADQREVFSDMQLGLIMAGLMIYVILAAVFSYWLLPLVILLTAPFGIIGAMLGHWLLGYDMTILSAFGVFTLSGIIVNDSIILVRDYLARLRENPAGDRDKMMVDATCRRLRAILLTSLTTIGGLTPLLFETSIQAQFLIPMAVSICFGLAFATLLILYLIPAYISIYNAIGRGILLLGRLLGGGGRRLTPDS